MNTKIILVSAILVSVLLGGIFVSKNKLLNPTPLSSDLEVFLSNNNASDDIKEAYRFAQENPQGVLSEVNCYCGCLKDDHNNNRDCFINNDGSFDLMGLNCGLCIKTALVSKAMLAEGKSVQEISDYVDAKWGKI